MADKKFSVEAFAGVDNETGRKLPPTHVEIEDGMWVLFAGTYYWSEESWDDRSGGEYYDNQNEKTNVTLVGINESDLRQKILMDRSRSSRNDRGYRFSQGGSSYWLVYDRPFGAIFEHKENGLRVGGLSFACARQVHKGELGRRPQIERPRFVREMPRQEMPDVSPVTGSKIKARDRKRGKYGWARLSDVAALAKMPAEEMLTRFWPFTNCEQPRLDVIIADNEQDLRTTASIGAGMRLTSQDRLTALHDCDAQVVWIRQGLALTILYLLHLGHVPDLPAITDPSTELIARS